MKRYLPDASSHNRVIRVHDGMHGKIHGSESAAGRGLRGPTPPAEEQCHEVVIPMQKDNGLFPQNQEKSINKLGDFAKAEKHDPRVSLEI